MTRIITRKIQVQSVTLWTAIKVAYFTALTFIVGLLLLSAIMWRFAPQNVRIAPGSTTGSLVGTIFLLLIFWPLFAGILFGVCGWIALRIKGGFSPTEFEIAQNERTQMEPSNA